MPESPALSAAGPPRTRRWLWRIVVLLILAAGIGGFVALQVFKPRPQVKPLVRQLPVVRAMPVQVLRDPLPVSGFGLVSPRTQVTLAAEIAGRVAAVHPQLVAGGRFEAGETLVELDPAPVRAALAQARADLKASEIALRLAEQSIERTRELIAQGFQSRQTLDEREASREQALAGLERARAASRQRIIDLDRTRIAAPFDGRVLSEQVNAGDTVQPGRELARIFDDTTLEVTVPLTDGEIAMIENPFAADGPRASATVIVEHGGHRYAWPARLARVEAAIDAASRTFNVAVAVAEARSPGRPLDEGAPTGPPLLLGMYAEVRITGRDQGPYVLVPSAALRESGSVWRLDTADVLHIVPARILGEHDDRVAIDAAPFSAGDRIVTSDLRVVTDGMQVRAAEDLRLPGGAPRS